MNISNNIPQMEIKADPQAQAWARSARNIILLTCESIAESLYLANEQLKAKGAPLFCLRETGPMNPEMLNSIILDTYREVSSQSSSNASLSVSQIALMGLKKQYPCTNSPTNSAAPLPQS